MLNKVLFIIVLLSFVVYYLTPVHPDEGVFATIAQGMLQGKVLYRDLFDHKPAGIHVILASIFYIFGDSFFTLRTVAVVTNIISSVLVYKLLITQVGEKIALFGTLAFLLAVPGVHGTYALTEIFIVPFLLVAIIIIVRHKREKWYPLGSGIACGIALLCNQSVILTVLMIGLIIFYRSTPNKRFTGTGMYVLGVSIPITIFVLTSAYYGALNEMINQVMQFVLVHYPPAIGKKTIMHWSFLLLSFGGFWICIVYSLTNIKHYRELKLVILCIIMSYIPSLAYRPYHHYWIPIIPLIIILSVLGMREKKWTQWLVSFNAIVVCGVFIVYSFLVGYPKLQYQRSAAAKIENCNEISDPIMYFLAKCTPEKKYFYMPE